MNLNSVHIRKILVPLDGSEASEGALPWAVELAGKHQAEIILLRVGRDPDLFDGQELHTMMAFQREQEEKCRHYLQELKIRLKSDAFVKVTLDYAGGKACRMIVEKASELGASLIVMNSHGRDGLERWWMGSVAEKVTRHAPCPVLLVRQPQVAAATKGEVHAASQTA